MPVQLNPAHAAVVIHSPQPTTHELKRPREEEEEVVMSQPLMDFELLTTIVSMYLEENSGEHPERAATSISSANPEICLQFTGSHSQIMNGLQTYLTGSSYSAKIKKFLTNTIHEMVVISLLNSRYQKVLETLEGNIQSYLSISTTENFHKMIDNTKALLSSVIPQNLSELQLHCFELNKALGEISEALDLFYYLDPEAEESIRLLAQNAKIDDEFPMFGDCQVSFPRLCQNLRTLSHEKTELTQLRREILEKQTILQRKQRELLEDQETKQAPRETVSMSGERSRFYNADPTFFWNNGILILKEVFVNTLLSHKSKAFTKELSAAMDLASMQSLNWSRNTFAELCPKKGTSPLPTFEDGYINEVWGHYTKEIDHLTDIGDFMRHFINSLPERSFEQLKASSDKAKDLRKAFLTFFHRNGKPNFQDLKAKAQKFQPLND